MTMSKEEYTQIVLTCLRGNRGIIQVVQLSCMFALTTIEIYFFDSSQNKKPELYPGFINEFKLRLNVSSIQPYEKHGTPSDSLYSICCSLDYH
jgi:hypothetical protein